MSNPLLQSLPAAHDRSRQESPLDDLCEDERKMLRVLYFCGPQAALGTRGDAPHPGSSVTIIGQEAGCLDLPNIPHFLARLHRRGMIQFSPMRLEPGRYEPLEDPDRLAAAGVRREQTRHCSIRLTPLGESSASLAFADIAGGPSSVV